ncbi:AI-2E family transporter [Duganella radicis]|uniref:AI-2E family transporter n=1 Tax=Duganella radicis TaxID=551988 RepID=A0A6L6PIP7_9BURK|nr:AI-2E family transporter [Duganella radicis]MTV38431.1 AI-2E family transporter [Duganella radicis]
MPPATPPPGSERSFLHRVVLAYGIGMLFILVLAALWYGAEVLLLLFACALFAILLYELSRRMARRLPMRRGVALAIVAVVLAALMGGGGWALAPQIAEQAAELGSVVPDAIERLRAAVAQNPFLHSILSDLPSAEQIRKQLTAMVPNAGLVFSGVFGALGNAVIILCVGLYFAAQPTLYIEGFIKLIPQPRRARAREVLDAIGDTLARWLVGKAVSMIVVGVATAAGLWALDVPLAMVLGLIAGLLDFIPYIGPLMAGVPAVLIAFSHSPELGLYTMLLFLAIQLAEGYLLSPLIEARSVSLPPALTIAMQMLFGALFGLAGIALATPLAAVLSVLTAMLYVEDVLGDAPPKPPDGA